MEIELEILEYSYWEHFKYAKDLHLILPLDHKKRVALDDEMNKMLDRIHKIKKSIERWKELIISWLKC